MPLLFYALNTTTLESNTMLFWDFASCINKARSVFNLRLDSERRKMRQRVSGMFSVCLAHNGRGM